jgi:hypothetical protein
MLLIAPGLQFEQARVLSVRGDQAIVVSTFADFAVLNNDNLIGGPDR